ncbi:MAG: hypothetical protein HWD61_07545 [Parachlamydiaceae bacterium]|nr:MAG: hypothetical protein HWD61_07545 [Parachlamydiaceae bacterium]
MTVPSNSKPIDPSFPTFVHPPPDTKAAEPITRASIQRGSQQVQANRVAELVEHFENISTQAQQRLNGSFPSPSKGVHEHKITHNPNDIPSAQATETTSQPILMAFEEPDMAELDKLYKEMEGSIITQEEDSYVPPRGHSSTLTGVQPKERPRTDTSYRQEIPKETSNTEAPEEGF